MPSRAEIIERCSKLQREIDQLTKERDDVAWKVADLDDDIQTRRDDIQTMLRDGPTPEPEAQAAPAVAEPTPEIEAPAEATSEAAASSIEPPVDVDPDDWQTWPLADLGLSQPIIDAFSNNGVDSLGQLSEMFLKRADLTSVGIGVGDASLVQQRYKEWFSLFQQNDSRVPLEPVAGA